MKDHPSAINAQSHLQSFLFSCHAEPRISGPLKAKQGWTISNTRQNTFFRHTERPTAYSPPEKILDKLFHWNCEWLTRPNYAISELADTLYANMATLAEYRDKVFARQPVDVLINKARPITRSFKDLTKGTPPPLKNRTSATPPLSWNLLKMGPCRHCPSICLPLLAQCTPLQPISWPYKRYSATRLNLRETLQIAWGPRVQTEPIPRIDGCLHSITDPYT